MLKRAVTLMQEHLKQKGHFTGVVDGASGPVTDKAVTKFLTPRAAELPDGAAGFASERRMVLALQLICNDRGVECKPVDGFWGPMTQFAYESLLQLDTTGSLPDTWRDDEPSTANPHNFPRDTGNQAAMKAFYGPAGSPPIKKVKCPWTLKLAWDTSTTVSHIGCHAKVADSAGTVLEKVFAHYGAAEIKRLRLDLYGGCFFNRKKRGGSTSSTHAWAVALDWDPSRNQLKWGRDRATLDHKDYDFWWHAWEKEGWVSLGRSRNFDWMHVQAARL